MAVTGTYTVNQICTRALRKIGVVAIDEDATAEILEIAREGLELMLKSWQNDGLSVFLKTGMTVTCTTSRNYTLDPVRPLEIESVRYNNGSSELPMERMTRDEYDRLPVKTSTGIPTQFYYDRQREAAVLYVWPVLATATGTLEITYIREIEDMALTDAVDLPGEMYNAAVYCLADELADDFPIETPGLADRVTRKAMTLYARALAFDREGSVFFSGPYAE